jgi:hypothetical protein
MMKRSMLIKFSLLVLVLVHFSETSFANALYCSLSQDTPLVDAQGVEIAVVKPEVRIDVLLYALRKGRIELDNFVAQTDQDPSVRVVGNELETISETALLSDPSFRVTQELALIHANVKFTVLGSVKGIPGLENATFHNIVLNGFLKDPVFRNCATDNSFN